jgi:hypothetical protein
VQRLKGRARAGRIALVVSPRNNLTVMGIVTVDDVLKKLLGSKVITSVRGQPARSAFSAAL